MNNHVLPTLPSRLNMRSISSYTDDVPSRVALFSHACTFSPSRIFNCALAVFLTPASAHLCILSRSLAARARALLTGLISANRLFLHRLYQPVLAPKNHVTSETAVVTREIDQEKSTSACWLQAGPPFLVIGGNEHVICLPEIAGWFRESIHPQQILAHPGGLGPTFKGDVEGLEVPRPNRAGIALPASHPEPMPWRCLADRPSVYASLAAYLTSRRKPMHNIDNKVVCAAKIDE